jgi:hypothetical protein
MPPLRHIQDRRSHAWRIGRLRMACISAPAFLDWHGWYTDHVHSKPPSGGLQEVRTHGTAAWRHAVLALAGAGSVFAAFAWPAFPQAPAYHQMADQRAWLGIPNALNVLSNLPFAVVGLAGLLVVFGRGSHGKPLFHDQWERWPYAALFGGLVLTAFGSGYYHIAPDNPRLVWDRLPMTLCFTGFLTAVLAERVSLRVARRLFGPLLAAGIASVAYWHWTELQNAGDLRFYTLMQAGSLILVLLILALHRSRYAGTEYLGAALAAYAAAKGLETADAGVFALGNIVSGHTLKHVAAAGAVACIAAMLRARRPRQTNTRSTRRPMAHSTE